MFTKIKTALSFARRVELLDYEDGLLTIRCLKALSFARTSVKFETSMGAVVAQVQVESYDATNDVYRVKVLDRCFALNNVVSERRENNRIPKVLRVTSKQLPGFVGFTEDISVTGTRIVSKGRPVEPEISLILELDDCRTPAISLKATVAWTAVKSDGTFQSGLRFTDVPEWAQSLIAQYVNSRLAMEKRLHTTENVDPRELM